MKTLGLVIEIDGPIHYLKKEYHAQRQKKLESYGLKVFRITNHNVVNNLDITMRELELFIIENYGV